MINLVTSTNIKTMILKVIIKTSDESILRSDIDYDSSEYFGKLEDQHRERGGGQEGKFLLVLQRMNIIEDIFMVPKI